MLATPPGSPSSPSRRNLDYAFPPFAMGLPSVYERAGFDVNKSRSRSGSRSSSLRSRSSSRNSSRNNSMSSASQNTMFGGPISNASSSSMNLKPPANSNSLNLKTTGGSSASLDKPSPLIAEQFNKFKLEQPLEEEEPMDHTPALNSHSVDHTHRAIPSYSTKEEPHKEVSDSPHHNNPSTFRSVPTVSRAPSEKSTHTDFKFNPNGTFSDNSLDPYTLDDKSTQDQQFEMSDEDSIYSLPESIDSAPIPPPHTSPLRTLAGSKPTDADSIIVDDSEFPSAIKPKLDFRFDDSESEISIQEPLQDGLMHTPSNESTREDIESVQPLHTNTLRDITPEKQMKEDDFAGRNQAQFNDPVQKPAQEPAQEPVREPILESAHESAHEPIHEPIHEPVREPLQKSASTMMESVAQPEETASGHNVPSKMSLPHLPIGNMRPMSPMNPMTPISPTGMSMHGMPPMSPRPQGMQPMSPRGFTPMSPRAHPPMPQEMPQHNFMPHNQPHLFNPQFAARPMPPPMNLPAMQMPQQPLNQPHTNNDEVFMQPKQRFPRGGNQSPKVGGNFSPSLSASKFNNPGMPGRNRGPHHQGPQTIPMPQGPQFPGGVPHMHGMQAASGGIPSMQGIPGSKRGNARTAIGPAHQAGEPHMIPPTQRRMRMPPGPQGVSISQGVPHGMPHGMSMPHGVALAPGLRGMPQRIPQGIPQGIYQGGYQGFPQGIPQGIPMYPGMPISQGVPQEQGMPMLQGVHGLPNVHMPGASRPALSDSDSPNTTSSPASSATSESEEDRQAKPNHPALLTVADRRISGSSSIYSARQSAMPPKHNTEPSSASSVSFDFNQPHLTTASTHAESHAPNRVSTWYTAEEGAQSREQLSNVELVQSPPRGGFQTVLTNESSSSQDLSLKSPSNSSQPDIIKSKPRKQCRGCMLPITGKSVRAQEGMLSGRWHRDCFKCVRCDQSLAVKGEVHVLNDQPFCSGCYHIANNSTCRMCGEGIEGSCLETRLDSDGDQPLLYHVNCLRCAQCHMKLQHSYFDVGGQTYCAEHAFTSLPDDQAVHKRYTQFKMI